MPPCIEPMSASSMKLALSCFLRSFAPHYTMLMSSLGSADDLAAAFGNLVVNPYADGGEEER